jgi:hypothetical protein
VPDLKAIFRETMDKLQLRILDQETSTPNFLFAVYFDGDKAVWSCNGIIRRELLEKVVDHALEEVWMSGEGKGVERIGD